MLFLAIVALGAVITGTNPVHTKFELAYHFKTARVSFVITEPELLSGVLGALEDSSIDKRLIWIYDSLEPNIPDGYSSWRALMECR
jgi:long-subunit acyl-CoA synthetase (AMP-forming)